MNVKEIYTKMIKDCDRQRDLIENCASELVKDGASKHTETLILMAKELETLKIKRAFYQVKQNNVIDEKNG